MTLLAQAGVEPLLGCDDALPTGTIVTLLSPDGERSFLTDRGANDRLCRADLPRTLLEGIDLLHVSGYSLVAPGPRAAVLALVEAAGACGIPVTVDPGSHSFLEEMGPGNFLRWMQGVRICFPNAAEAAMLAGTGDPGRQLDLLTRTCPLVVVKRGADGAAAGAADGRRWSVPARTLEALDTSGAGDAFLAGFLAGWLAGAGVELCLSQGVETGSRAVTMLGARPAAGRSGRSQSGGRC